jgi:hypothetical protein
MATAKQIAWRKKFAEMARSGNLTKAPARKSAKKATKNFPAKLRDSQVEGHAYYAQMAEEIKAERAARKKNPLPTIYKVQSRSGDGRAWTTIIRTTFEKDAIKAARVLHESNPNRAYRVIDTDR